MKWILIGIFIPALTLARPESSNPFRDAEKWIHIVNNDPQSTWKAGRNFNPDLPRRYLKSLLGMLKSNSSHPLPIAKPITDFEPQDIPLSFDSRKQWKNCKSLQEIRDQGDCGSCWAVAAASAFADRLCIASKGKVNVHLSQEELLACCSECGEGCDGGYPNEAWRYFKNHGIATGGDYASHDGCQPYSLKPCEHHVKGKRPSCPSLDPTETPVCRKLCTNKKYSKPLDKDLKKVKTAYGVSPSVQAIQKEILKYGPVEAGFDVYEDFLTYKSGVYKHNPASKYLSGHAVKLIGWGVEKEVEYWLVQNSWNYDWGDKGLFKILRGTDECSFESEITAGIPKV